MTTADTTSDASHTSVVDTAASPCPPLVAQPARPRTQAEALQAISDALKSIADIPPLQDRGLPKASLARKKRREKMRSGVNRDALEALSSTTTAAIRAPPKKRRPPSDNGGSGKRTRTQMRYNPDVPMTKEETTQWRREARRVRNRESAAASRAKTRDRIAELEDEVNRWKARYEELAREFGPRISVTVGDRLESELEERSQGEHLNEQILEPAVKIAGAPLCSLRSTPYPCVPEPSIVPSSLSLPDPNPVSSCDESSKDDEQEDPELEDFVVDAFLDGINVPDMRSCVSNGAIMM